jgi:hypothetical protein
MPTHQFHVGQLVQLAPALSCNVPGGSYEIIKKLPESGGEFEYQIKSLNEAHQRVVRWPQFAVAPLTRRVQAVSRNCGGG